MTNPLHCACVQTTTGPDFERNLRESLQMIREAASRGATLIGLPEAVDLLDADNERMRAFAAPMHQHPALKGYRAAARELGVAVLVGSIAALNESGQMVNRCVFIDRQGAIACYYDKVHLFDAAPGEVVSTESKLYVAGTRAVVAELDHARIGLSICYDLRFPQLFRTLAKGGANVLAIPAAFMQVTGEAHWHALMRARAIENGCFVFAPAQCGNNYGARQSFGHSIIIDPWGRVLAETGTEPGIIDATLDLALVQQARRAIPSLGADRPFSLSMP
ncbi:carbon-nitrogen hydrolase family protein [Massilia cavernae]|uniref:Carbon-nitrogen hydrolase family protein n=1 Tax=Massilia cavernae TaxID=2320864 RepID=A0A418XR25_9BURK|nr:carbon-nitrogen hydrolase family protein [Massilia cavernae]RJG14866.1 carbon-nitrogen hydrolase family protein [Massilia cavernae]